MTTIKDVRVWHGRKNRKSNKGEARIYVHTVDNREGCLYLTGNPWNAKGSITGDLTEAEWQEARAISIWDGKWHTVYENEIHRQQQTTTTKQYKAKVVPAATVLGWKRQQKNNYLRNHGYRWQKITEEDMDAFGGNAFNEIYGYRVDHVWELIAPGGRVVTVKQALEEIEAGK